MEDVLTHLFTQLDTLLPSRSTFISQFNSLVAANDIVIDRDLAGNIIRYGCGGEIGMSTSGNISDAGSQVVADRLAFIDSAINARKSQIQSLIMDAMAVNAQSGNTRGSVILSKVAEFERISNSYS